MTTRTCREFMLAINDPYSKVNCASCVKWNRETQRCKDEEGVVQRYEDTPEYDKYKSMMQDAKDIRMD